MAYVDNSCAFYVLALKDFVELQSAVDVL